MKKVTDLESFKAMLDESLSAIIMQSESDSAMILSNLAGMIKASMVRSVNSYLPEIHKHIEQYVAHFDERFIELEEEMRKLKKTHGVKDEA